MENFHTISDMNEFLQKSLKEPDQVCESLEETKRMLDALHTKEAQEDNKRLEGCKAMLRDIVELKEIRERLTDAPFATHLAEVEKEKEQAEQRQAFGVSQKEELNAILEQIEVEKKRIEEQKTELNSVITNKHKSVRATYELYRTITGLEFNQNAEPDKCEGYVALESDTRTFSLDQKTTSAHDIANYLWDLMDGEAKPESS